MKFRNISNFSHWFNHQNKSFLTLRESRPKKTESRKKVMIFVFTCIMYERLMSWNVYKNVDSAPSKFISFTSDWNCIHTKKISRGCSQFLTFVIISISFEWYCDLCLMFTCEQVRNIYACEISKVCINHGNVSYILCVQTSRPHRSGLNAIQHTTREQKVNNTLRRLQRKSDQQSKETTNKWRKKIHTQQTSSIRHAFVYNETGMKRIRMLRCCFLSVFLFHDSSDYPSVPRKTRHIYNIYLSIVDDNDDDGKKSTLSTTIDSISDIVAQTKWDDIVSMFGTQRFSMEIKSVFKFLSRRFNSFFSRVIAVCQQLLATKMQINIKRTETRRKAHSTLNILKSKHFNLFVINDK